MEAVEYLNAKSMYVNVWMVKRYILQKYWMYTVSQRLNKLLYLIPQGSKFLMPVVSVNEVLCN